MLQGTYRPHRAVANEVPPELVAEIPSPPEGLGEWGQREWDIACRWLHDVGNLATTDLALLSMYCNEVSNYWEYDAQVKTKGAVVAIKNKDGVVVKVQRSPYTSLRKEALDLALRLATQFGFTAAARSRLTMGPNPADKPKSRLTQLMDRRN